MAGAELIKMVANIYIKNKKYILEIESTMDEAWSLDVGNKIILV